MDFREFSVHVDADPLAPTRPFFVSGPAGAERPVLLALHGQYGTPQGERSAHDFDAMAKEKFFTVAYLAGEADSLSGSGNSAWNVGSNGDTNVCNANTNATCFSSCQRLAALQGRTRSCGRCDWAPCYDDVAYVKAVLRKLQEATCVDPERVYVYGESNGGMLVHRLLQKLPGEFAAAVSSQGLPLAGYASASNDLAAVMHLRGMQDTVIPSDGSVGKDSGGWHYATLDGTYGPLAAMRGCGPAEPSAMPGAGGALRCSAHRCSKQGRYGGYTDSEHVVLCAYNGGHGDYPKLADKGDGVVWDFVSQFRRVPTEGPRRVELRKVNA